MSNLMKNLGAMLFLILLGVSIFSSQCLAGVDLMISGKYTFPKVGCSGDTNDWVFIKFPKAFSSTPTVIVTQEVPPFNPEYGDSYLIIKGITKLGFDVQRRSVGNNVCNEVGTVNYIAIGS